MAKTPGKQKAKKDTPSILTGTASGSVATPPTSASATPSAAVIAATDVIATDDDIILTDAEGRRYCRATDCDQLGVVDGYCRYHYLYFWKKIQNRKKILADGKLDRYVEELTARYADKFLEMLRKDLRTEKDFIAAIQELELDDSTSASDDADDKTYLEEIRGMGDETGSRADDDSY
jgi:hypothetical protein